MRNTFIILGLILGLLFLPGCTGAGNSVEEQSDRAATLNNPSLCNSMEEQSKQIECMARVADLKSDPKICVASNASIVDCVVRYAQRRNNISACDIISDPVKKYTCVAKFTGDSTGRSLDIIIADFNTQGKVSACLRQCTTDLQACRSDCEVSQYAKNLECEKLDKDYGPCYAEAINVKNTCQVRCRDVALGACETKCREIG